MTTKADIIAFAERVTTECKNDPMFKERPEQAPVIEVKFARKYAKLTTNNGGSAWGFVDMNTGELLKAAGWSTPAKHARGHISTARYGYNYVWTGPVYLR